MARLWHRVLWHRHDYFSLDPGESLTFSVWIPAQYVGEEILVGVDVGTKNGTSSTSQITSKPVMIRENAAKRL